MDEKVKTAAKHFKIPGELVTAELYGNGHINDTYKAVYRVDGKNRHVIHQRINHQVFKNPKAQMENIERVTSHIRQKCVNEHPDQVARHTLSVVPTEDGQPIFIDEQGNYWRTYEYIKGTQSYEVAVTPEQARQAARAFGRFQKELSDLPGDRLHEIIPDFHNTPMRVEALEKAIADDPADRVKTAGPEIEFALGLKDIAPVLIKLYEEQKIPERIVHNDTKFNNILFDLKTREAICVTDLDTVMPGFIHYDFGDMVRTTTSFAEEDETDLSKVVFQLPMFEALARGYLEEMEEVLNETEKEYLVFSGKLITYEIGIRFLTDHLLGDSYFKTSRENHNLDRCRTQFKLIESMQEAEGEMHRVVRDALTIGV